MNLIPLPTGFRIADVQVEVETDVPGLHLLVSPDEVLFQAPLDGPHIRLVITSGPLPPVRGELLFDSHGLWKLYADAGGRTLVLGGRRVNRVALMDAHLTQGTVVCSLEMVQHGDEVVAVEALRYPLLELLTYWRVTAGGGLGVHCSGVVHEGRGFLFAGQSGAGKSTLSELWAGVGATVLSDDRVCLRLGPDGGVRLFGTPWHGTAAYASAQSARLERIFFIEHSPKNWLTPVAGAEAAAQLLAFSFVPQFDPEMTALASAAAHQVTAAVPCARLGFVPDPSVIPFVLDAV